MTDLLKQVDVRTASLISRAATHRITTPLLVGLLGLVISLIGITIPSIWYDEAATISAATRSWPQLWQMVGNVDAVHAVYYFFMHVVFDVFGYSPLSLRLPSALATGLAGALTVVLGRQFVGERTAILAGIVLCLLPRVTWMGTEGRSYAFSVVLAALLTIVFVRAQRVDPAAERGNASSAAVVQHVPASRDSSLAASAASLTASSASSAASSRCWWLLYGVLVVISCLMFIYLALIVVAHGMTMAWWLSTAGRHAVPTVRRWFVASAVPALLLLPFAQQVVDQNGQIDWIEPLGPDTFRQVFRTQWFLYSTEFAIAGCLLMVFGVIMMLRHSRGFSLAAVILPALVVPTVALLVATEFYSPLFSPRYLTMGVPFLAIAIAAGIAALPHRALVVVTIVGIVGLAIPPIIEERQPNAKQESTWRQVADLIADERAGSGAEQTAVIWGPVRYHPSATARAISYSYPDAFAGTIDVTLETPAAETGGLWAERGRLGDSLDNLDNADVAYLITSIKRDRRPSTTEALASIGWELTESWNLIDVNVLRYEPSG